MHLKAWLCARTVLLAGLLGLVLPALFPTAALSGDADLRGLEFRLRGSCQGRRDVEIRDRIYFGRDGNTFVYFGGSAGGVVVPAGRNRGHTERQRRSRRGGIVDAQESVTLALTSFGFEYVKSFTTPDSSNTGSRQVRIAIDGRLCRASVVEISRRRAGARSRRCRATCEYSAR
ncbi:hypothetical protein [Jiella sonneratiae]|uniref:Uncharacterized protein n=1 Tax=Jiella sonneratiae TaxID=2816856 RepID=A0ABS3J4I2_9HYPH|nr:hypothetical protein [Jiella sonneratiae]MBO0904030.1 hypothetical protein [Jiella sonneratiae]